MTDNPLISIIVPIYNVEEYLSQCLDSLIDQTYRNIEIICVNDGSQDHSDAILHKYSQKDNRLIIISTENHGVSYARNLAIQNSHGDYLMFVDADDWIEADTCEIAISKAIRSDGDIIMWGYVSEYQKTSTNKLVFDKENTFEGESLQRIHRRFVGVIGDELSRPEMADSLCPVWAKLYRKSSITVTDNRFIQFTDLDRIGTYEDGLWNLHVFGRISKAVYISRSMYHYRRTNSISQTSNYRPALYSQWGYLFDSIQKYIDENGSGEEYQTALNNRIALSVTGLGLNILSANMSGKRKRKALKSIITSERYKLAYRSLNYNYFPLHWKTFYTFAKNGNVHGLYILLLIIRRIISR